MLEDPSRKHLFTPRVDLPDRQWPSRLPSPAGLGGNIMKPIRSFLFVPGNKESMLDECAAAGAPDVGRARPMQVETINRTYTPTDYEVAFYRGMIEALDAAQAEGLTSVMYHGEHADIAHVKASREIIALAEAIGS